ncbi:MAG: class I SAM-dependent methyltransferase [Pseudomonadota bacterium]|jgi:SAM-dependent methyltransferase|nr:class I SAM-dependent methyltransferase [Alphaproteobacteria bacterium]
MNIDVVDLKEFYRSALAEKVKSIIKQMLTYLRKNNIGKRTLFVGFGAPYGNINKNEFLLMHAHFGALAWPDNNRGRVTLSYENEWAFSDHLFDEIIIVHGLEYAQNADGLLQECYRCLCPEGRLVVIVPNRRSFWIHSGKTPFSFGHPYTLSQISSILKKHDFIITDATRGLYSFPTSTWFMNLASWVFERIASTTLQKFSGLVGVVAIKRVYAGIPIKKLEKQRPVILAQSTS